MAGCGQEGELRGQQKLCLRAFPFLEYFGDDCRLKVSVPGASGFHWLRAHQCASQTEKCLRQHTPTHR